MCMSVRVKFSDKKKSEKILNSLVIPYDILGLLFSILEHNISLCSTESSIFSFNLVAIAATEGQSIMLYMFSMNKRVQNIFLT